MGTCASLYLFAEGKSFVGLGVPRVYMSRVGKAWVTVKVPKCSSITSLFTIL